MPEGRITIGFGKQGEPVTNHSVERLTIYRTSRCIAILKGFERALEADTEALRTAGECAETFLRGDLETLSHLRVLIERITKMYSGPHQTQEPPMDKDLTLMTLALNVFQDEVIQDWENYADGVTGISRAEAEEWQRGIRDDYGIAPPKYC
jgi:hypothetical protein